MYSWAPVVSVAGMYGWVDVAMTCTSGPAPHVPCPSRGCSKPRRGRWRLARWGARALGDPREGDIVTADSMVMALRSTFEPSAARGLRAAFELRIGDVEVHARIRDGRLEAGRGRAGDADLIIEAGPAIRAVMAGEISTNAAVANGAVHMTGSRDLFDRFVELFPVRPLAATATDGSAP
jgi:hypothetical protein